MRIAFFLPTLGGGGAERMQIHLANALAARGHGVCMVVGKAAGPVRESLSPAVQLVDLAKGRSLSALLPLARYLRRQKPQVLISALSHGNFVALLARRLAPFSRTKVIVTERNALGARLHDAGRGWRLAFPLLLRLLYPLADRVVGVSRGVSAEVRAFAGLGHDAVTTINNPTVTADLAKQAGMAPERKDLLALDRPIVATAGRLGPQKDQACLLRAFARSAPRHDAVLVILGEGPLRGELEGLAERLGISERVFFLGFVANPLPFLKRCKLFVLSSRYEGFGNVLVEALYCGLPIVSTDCPHGPAEILDGGRYGTLVPVGDDAALAEAMTAALTRRHDREAQHRRALDFSAEAVADRYEALFREILRAPRPGPRLEGRSAMEL